MGRKGELKKWKWDAIEAVGFQCRAWLQDTSYSLWENPRDDVITRDGVITRWLDIFMYGTSDFKNRFQVAESTLGDGEWWIRSTTGHSQENIKDALMHKEITLANCPIMLYHSMKSERDIVKIRIEGLKVQKEKRTHLFFTKRPPPQAEGRKGELVHLSDEIRSLRVQSKR